MNMITPTTTLDPVVKLAIDSGAKPSDIENVEDAFNYLISTDTSRRSHHDFDKDTIVIFRKAVRNELLRLKLIDPESPDTFEIEFSGGGDSGDLHDCVPDNPWVNRIFEWYLLNEVHFDWYNNEGGGGDMTWYLDDDTIVINGYFHVTEQVSAMSEEEF